MPKRRFGLALCFLLSLTCIAQVNSPYSRIGIGNLVTQGSADGRGLGITATQSQNATGISIVNPATYALFARSHQPIFRTTKIQGSFSADFLQIETQDDGLTSGNGTLGDLSLGFPLGAKGGLAVALNPMSRVQYGIKEILPDTADLTQNNFYEGRGNLYRFTLGSAYEWKQLAIGANINYMFGRTDNIKSVEFPDLANSLGAKTETQSRPSGVFWDLGLHYRYNLKETFASTSQTGDSLFDPQLELSAGISLRGQQNIGVERSKSSFQYITSNGLNIDTTSQVNQSFDMVLPSEFNFALALSKRRQWTIGFQYSQTAWSSFKGFQGTDTLVNANKIALGFEIAIDSSRGFLDENKKVRIGVHYGNSYLSPKGTQLTDFGMTFGFGIPMTRFVATREGKLPIYNYLDLSLDVGQRGSIDNGLIKENYFKASLGLTLNYRWFNRIRYD